MHEYERIRANRFPNTWTALRLGWKGHNLSALPMAGCVTTAQLQSFAVDQITDGSSEREVLAVKLACADEWDDRTIERCLAELASDAPADIAHALRIWQWLAFDEVVTNLEKQARTGPAESAPDYGAWSDDFRTSVSLDLRDFQTDFEPVFFTSGFLTDWDKGDWLLNIPNTLRFIQTLREWLTQEADQLRGGKT
jgi:hypothetical protein